MGSRTKCGNGRGGGTPAGARQGELVFRTWGGPRPGAGRKPKAGRRSVPHRQRAALAARYPVHVTVRLCAGLPTLRRRATYAALRAAFAAGCDRFGFRLCQYSVQSNHVHLIAEARDRNALSRGIKGLLVRVARALNRLWRRRGRVFAERYHDRILRTPREVRRALAYVLNNARRHGVRLARALDHFATGYWFDGWRTRITVANLPATRPSADARTWLLTAGWRRHGLLGPHEVPGRAERRGAGS